MTEDLFEVEVLMSAPSEEEVLLAGCCCNSNSNNCDSQTLEPTQPILV